MARLVALAAAGFLLLSASGDSGGPEGDGGRSVQLVVAADETKGLLGWDGGEWLQLRQEREDDWSRLIQLVAEIEAEEERVAREMAAAELASEEPAEMAVDAVQELESRRLAALREVIDEPDGLEVIEAVPSPVADWFEMGQGLEFFVDRPGDGTAGVVRRVIPESRYFYYDGYPEGIPNFVDGSMGDWLAEEMAREAAVVLPDLYIYEDTLARGFRHRLAWELRQERPGLWVNVWTRFRLQDGPDLRVFAVGGVMGFRLVEGSGAADPVWDRYLEPTGWVGPVVVERLF